jgi:glutaminase
LIGPSEARAKLGAANATGLAFNSLAAIETMPRGVTNPMPSTPAPSPRRPASRPGANQDEKWRFIHDGLSRFAGCASSLNDEVYASATAHQFPRSLDRPDAGKHRRDLWRSGRGG